MTALRIHFRSQLNSTTACIDDPPQDQGTDDCRILLPLRDEGQGGNSVRMVQFERSGDQFILSPGNNVGLREWYEGHANTAEIENILRLTGSLLRTGQEVSPAMATVYTVFASYLVTGETRMPGSEDRLGDPFQLANGILSTFADSGDAILGRLLGRLQVLRRSAWAGRIDGMIDRISWVNSILDVVPQLHTVRREFFSEGDIALLVTNEAEVPNLNANERERYDRLIIVDNFIRELVLTRALERPFTFNRVTLRAMNAYMRNYEQQLNEGQRRAFQDVVAALLEGMGEDVRGGEQFLEDVRAFGLVVPPDEENATLFHIHQLVVGALGRAGLREAIAEESSDLGRERDWFFPEDGSATPSFALVSENFQENLDIHYPEHPQDNLRIEFNFQTFRMDLDLLISSHSNEQRDYILLGLAYLRTFFGSRGDLPSIRLYQDGRMRPFSLTVSEEELANIRTYIRSLENQLEGPDEESNLVLPILEGVACGVGAAGAVFAELYPDVNSDQGLRLGIGTPSAAVGSWGCTSLATHLILDAVDADVDRPLVEQMVGLGGGIVGGLLFSLLSFFLNGQGGNNGNPGMRFPVDPYGP